MSEIDKEKNKIITICKVALSPGAGNATYPPTQENFEETLDRAIEWLGHDGLTKEMRNDILFRLKRSFSVKISPTKEAIVLSGQNILPWLAAKECLTFNRSERFENFQENHELVSRSVISAHDEVIEQILDLSGDPETEGNWRRKGLVMGNVQSGKTMNYIGLINKACDVGYKTFIVLGGHMNELRKQTQERVDQGFLGIETGQVEQVRGAMVTQGTEAIGVGLVETETQLHIPRYFTSSIHDFSVQVARRTGGGQVGTVAIVVIKKLPKLMRALINWINNHAGLYKAAPMLIIDDEADYASINTQYHRGGVAATNLAILDLIDCFDRSTYVAYTATPFANVFIPTDQYQGDKFQMDLFPSDFMVKLPISENYDGQDYFFPDEDSVSDDFRSPVIIIDEEEIKGWLPLNHKKDHEIMDLSASLKQAINTFVLVGAIRRLRGHGKQHNSMLVNASRFNDPQKELYREINEYVIKIKNALKTYASLGVKEARKQSKIITALEETHLQQYSHIENIPNFQQLLERELFMSANAIELRYVWGQQVRGSVEENQILNYKEYEREGRGLSVIAIGGFKLSRGLTIKGLSVSYYLRNARASDTLTQMCRWYGYHDGFRDLCRVWMSERSYEHYSTTSLAINELYDDLETMNRMKATPRTFGLRVRAHDHTLLVTAKNKMGTGTKMIDKTSFWGTFWMRMVVTGNDKKAQKNLKSAENILEKVKQTAKYDSNSSAPIVLHDVEYQSLIDFVEQIDMVAASQKNFQEKPLLIRRLKQMGEHDFPLPKIVLFNQSGKRNVRKSPLRFVSSQEQEWANKPYEFAGENINLRHQILRVEQARNEYRHKSNSLGDSDDEKYLLSAKEYDRIRKEFYRERGGKKGSPKNLILRHSVERIQPVLFVYLGAFVIKTHPAADQDSYKLATKIGVPSLVYGISFPTSTNLLQHAPDQEAKLWVQEDYEKVEYLVNEVTQFNENELRDEEEEQLIDD